MIHSIALFLPELFLLVVAGALLVRILVHPHRRGAPSWFPWLVLVGILVSLASLGQRGTLFYEAYRVDALSQFFKMAIAVGFFFAVQNGFRQPELEDEKRTDYFFFLTLSALGLMLLSSAAELVTIFVALELSSYSVYALVPMRKGSKESAEAGIKYILFGAAATAVSLYGLSYIMVTQHSTYLADLAQAQWIFTETPLAVVGILMFLAGFFYKLALFPFHFWTPDVYQGASNETATYIATLPKLGAVVVLIRLATFLQPGMAATDFLAVLAAVSMTFGNLAALAQTDVKRILGYSTVAHAGYTVVGLVSGTAAGFAAAAFYSLIYVLMNLACFWVLCRLSPGGSNIELEDLDGLHSRRPGLAFVLAVGAFALVGLPPTGGFMGKLFLFTSAWGHGYNWLVILGALNTAISIYYYLNMVRHAYTKDSTQEPLKATFADKLWASVLAGAVLLLGVIPGPVFSLVSQAGRELMP